MGRIVTMDMATGPYIDKRDCFQYVEFFFIRKSWRHSRAGCNIVVGQIQLAGRNLPTPALDDALFVLLLFYAIATVF